MFIKQYIFLSLLCLHNLSLSAQIDDLLKNKNITWVAEIYTDFYVDNPALAVEKDANRVRIIKLQPNPKISGDDFIDILEDIVYSEKAPIFSDSTCQNQISKRFLFPPDSVERYDSIKQERKKIIIFSCGFLLFPEGENTFIRVRQVVYYDAKRAQFGLRTLAFAPMAFVRNESGEFLGSRPVFWMKAEDIIKRPRLSSAAITWAKMVVAHNGFDTKNVKILKQTGENMPILHFLNVAEKEPKKTFFSGESYINMVKLPFSERSSIFFRRDTIYENSNIGSNADNGFPDFTRICFPQLNATAQIIDTSNYLIVNKIDTVKDFHLDKKTITRLRLVQEWFWDDSKHKLSIRLVAVAPIKELINEKGEFMFYLPLFYRRIDKD